MADSGFLTIGKVVKKLQTLYPDLSVSKVRYLQDEGLLTPTRTAGGYRRIYLELRNRGYLVNHKRVQGLMKVLNLQAKMRQKRK